MAVSKSNNVENIVPSRINATRWMQHACAELKNKCVHILTYS